MQGWKRHYPVYAASSIGPVWKMRPATEGAAQCSEHKYLSTGELTAIRHPHGFALCHQSKLLPVLIGLP